MQEQQENIMPQYLFLIALLKHHKLIRAIKKSQAEQRKELFERYKMGETSALEDLKELNEDLEIMQKQELTIKTELIPFNN